MKKTLLFALMLETLFVFSSCDNTAVRDMQDRVDELEARLAAMEQEQQTSNGSSNNQSSTTPSGSSQSSVSGTIDGHDYVDLGLPSGTLWATCNVGANSPEEYGEYFAWGETSPKSDYSWSTYQYGLSSSALTKYCNNSSYGKNGFTDNKTVLDAEDDAATVNWGSGWRIPTLEEILELYDSCFRIWTTQNGVKGRKFTALNGNSIFLPAAGYYDGSGLSRAASSGYYWSSSLGTYGPTDAHGLSFALGEMICRDYRLRYYGWSVRPVVR